MPTEAACGKLARFGLAFVAVSLIAMHFGAQAYAQSSLGIGVNDGGVPPASGVFGHLMNWVNLKQQGFYRSLTGSLKAMRDDRGQMWWMVGLSFAYGIFHAAGPGHGKAVISSYMLANEVALRRGILLSFVSAFLQAATAIAVMALAFLVLRGTTVSMTDATHFLEVASYGLITLFGAWLLWKKLAPRLPSFFVGRPLRSLSAATVEGRDALSRQKHSHGEACGCDHYGSHSGRERLGHAHASAAGEAAPRRFQAEAVPHGHGADEVCASCGHAHAPDPAMISGDRFDWRTAWSAVAAVGLRPCSGALIVLSFAFLNGIWAGGVLSVLAMALGTAITVSLLATLAVTAKGWAVRLAGDGRTGNGVHAAIEIGGAAMVFLFGLALLSASLSG